MDIKPTNSNQCDLPMTNNHIVFYNWNTGNYDHYKADILTKAEIQEIKDKYKLIEDTNDIDEDRESELSTMSHDMDEYHNDLAEEFADEIETM
jgi:NAD(P)H-flavin reductase